jgi:hypothetical protein
MRRFYLQRDEDLTGISGTGRIAEGVCFSTGDAALRWLTEEYSFVVYPGGMRAVEAIHGHGGRTRIVWIDLPDGL